MTTDIDQLLEDYRRALVKLSEANAAYFEQDENRKIILARQTKEFADQPLTKAEVWARASEPYALAIGALVELQRAAENAKADVEFLRARFEAWRTRSATLRAMRQRDD